MTTQVPRGPYSKEELNQLYPKGLELQLVQILLRHGERSPVSARFQNAGLPPYWPYCNAAQQLRSVAMTPTDVSQWSSLQWRRRLERFGEDDGPVIAAGPNGKVDGICQPGELTDKGRETTYALGARLRHLYVDQLHFMPSLISSADMIYLRATHMPRALESVQQTFWGMYPLTARTASFPAPTIITRTLADETLYPNDVYCMRFNQLSRAFAQRTADRWNETDEMRYLNKMISKWMPSSSPQVLVDSHPRLSGIMDTVNSTLAHGPETRLPPEFYDDKLRKIIDQIGVEEWFSGYKENREYRTLGIGSLVGDVVERVTAVVEGSGLSVNEIGGRDGSLGQGRGGEKDIKFAMSGCHDTTLAAMLCGFGAFDDRPWPPYTSHIAIEMFRKIDDTPQVPGSSEVTGAGAKRIEGPGVSRSSNAEAATAKQAQTSKPGFFASLLGLSSSITKSSPSDLQTIISGSSSKGIGRRPLSDLSSAEKSKLDGYYVRLRYNDEVVIIPGCRKPGKHLDGDESICTLAAFKAIADDFTPRNWKKECSANVDAESIRPPGKEEWAGYEKEG